MSCQHSHNRGNPNAGRAIPVPARREKCRTPKTCGRVSCRAAAARISKRVRGAGGGGQPSTRRTGLKRDNEPNCNAELAALRWLIGKGLPMQGRAALTATEVPQWSPARTEAPHRLHPADQSPFAATIRSYTHLGCVDDVSHLECVGDECHVDRGTDTACCKDSSSVTLESYAWNAPRKRR